MAVRRPSSRLVAIVLRYALSIAALLWLAHNVAWSDFTVVSTLDATLLAVAAAIAGLAYPLQAWRWQILLRTQGIAPPTGAVHRAFWIGHFYNSFLPGGIAGDAVRFAWVWRVAPTQKSGNAASLVIDRLLGFITLFALAAVGLGIHLATRGVDPQLLSLWIGALAAFAAASMAWWAALCGHWWEKPAARILGVARATALRSLAQCFRLPPAALVVPIALSVAIWLLDFASLWLLAHAVGLSISLMAVASAAAAAYAAAALPISIGGHGVRETALVAVLTLFGAGDDRSGQLTTLALVFWVVTVGWALFGGALYWVCFLFAASDRPASDPRRSTTS